MSAMRDYSRRPGLEEPGETYETGTKPGAVTLTQRLPASRAAGAQEVPYRAEMEQAFGRDFSFVSAYTGKPAEMDAIGAQAAAHGSSIAFADSAPTPWLVAHELTHVVQQEQGGAQTARKATIAPAESAAEHEADRVADRVVRGEPAGEISAQPGNAVYRFAPGHHQAATVAGLSNTFSAEEIGAIYASNWERDFSQGHPDIASAAIAWTAVKNADRDGKDLSGPAATFQAAVWKVVSGNLTDATTESLGDYKYWEHMDHPTATLSSPDKDADKRWGKKAAGLAGYIMDAKAHIKDQMVAAIDHYREMHRLEGVGGSIDNWGGVAKPDGYVAPNVTADRKAGTVSTTMPANWDDPKVASRAPIADETAADAKAAGAKSSGKHDAAGWAMTAQLLGRAMHAFEDFWAHSNWLELAKGLHEAKEKGGTAAPVANSAVKTGTFGMPAKAHALGHKLLALASAFQKDQALMLKVYGMKKASTKLDDPEAKKKRSTMWGGQSIAATNDHELAYNALKTDSWSTVGEISDVGDAVNNVEELVLSGKYTMADFLTNQSWLAALADKGKTLIKQGDDNSDEDSHGKLAKDQPEGDGHKDHGGAMVIAKAANEAVFGPLRAIMDEKDAAKALAATQTQLALVDTMIQAPSEGHPLWGHVAAAVEGPGGHSH